MNVKVKKGVYKTPAEYFIAAVLLLLGGSGGGLLGLSVLRGGGLASNAAAIVLFTCFAFFFAIMGVFAIIQYFLPNKTIRATLRVKGEEYYNGKTVTAMVFDLPVPEYQKSYKPNTASCYVDSDAGYTIGKTYTLERKAYNGEIVRILEAPELFDESRFKQETVNTGFSAGGALQDDLAYDFYEENPAFKQETGTNAGAGDGTMSTTGTMSAGDAKILAKLEALGVLQASEVSVSHTRDDNDKIRHCEIKVVDDPDVENCKLFYLMDSRGRGTWYNTKEFVQYYVVNERLELVYRIKRASDFLEQFVISDHKDRPIATLKKNAITFEHILHLVGKNAISVRPKLGMSAGASVIGSDIMVTGQTTGFTPEFMFSDKSGRLLANMYYEKSRPNNFVSYRIVLNLNAKFDPLVLLLGFTYLESLGDTRSR